MEEKISGEGLSFDDVLVIPRFSEILPQEVDTSTFLTKKIALKIPLVSSPMDTVTEHQMAIVLAQEGGIGIIHRNLSIEKQRKEVRRVKRFRAWIIEDPVTVYPEMNLSEVLELIEKCEHRFSSFPVIKKDGRLVGIITYKDFRFVESKNSKLKVKDLMSKNLITVNEGISLEEAKKVLQKNKIGKILLVDKNHRLKGLITDRDIEKAEQYPLATLDEKGRLRVGGAVGTGEKEKERAEALIKEGVDVLVVDSAHGDSKNVLEMISFLKKNFSIEVIGGNVATFEGAKRIIEAGADAVKVGVGPGSICTTRVVAGVGVPQITAILEVAKICQKESIPLIADGGIKYSGEIVKALVAGASSVMIGNLFAGTDEAPGEVIHHRGRVFKEYRGMGSLGALKKEGQDRYLNGKVPEGIEGMVPYRGKTSKIIFQLIGGLKAGMGYVGVKNIPQLQEVTRFIKITGGGFLESHPHGVLITKEAPNYTPFQKEE